MDKHVAIIGAGLAGTEAALQLARRNIAVDLFEMRPVVTTDVHKTDGLAELVCSNSLKSEKPTSAAGMLKHELSVLGSALYSYALDARIPAGGALAVDRTAFSAAATAAVEENPLITLHRVEVRTLARMRDKYDALVVATGPLTSDALANELAELFGMDHLAFFDAAAPIVEADSLDYDVLFRQNRYEWSEQGAAGEGDYLNAPFTREEYEAFIDELLAAERVIARDFETKDLFQACQPVEEVARAGRDALRFGALKPVGLTDPRTGRRPWAAVQLRAENEQGTCYNLVGFQTNLKFGEQKRVFRMIPGLEHAEFSRFGVMHRNTFIDAPRLLDANLRVRALDGAPVHVAGQLAGTEGYCEAIRSGLHAALAVAAELAGKQPVALPRDTAFGALLAYATDPATENYQPMHVNFGIMDPIEPKIKNKAKRYEAYAARGSAALDGYVRALCRAGLLEA